MEALLKLKEKQKQEAEQQKQDMDNDVVREEHSQQSSNNSEIGAFGPPEIDPSEIVLEQEIGTGSFGKVFKGKCREQPVAVKVLHKMNFDKRTLIAFKREVKIMSKIFHPNICLFMGACLAPGQCWIVTELLPKGDLEKLLKNKQVILSSITRLKMAKDAALGMNWLHCSNPVFIHRDLKSSNLLVDNNLTVKVCDFGLSQLIPKDKKIKDKQNAKGTPLWMAPEVMQFQEFNEKCDVYSYGIVLWEIVTRDEPFGHHTSFDKFKEAVCVHHERPPIPDDVAPSLRKLMTDCWHPDPQMRPSFKEIIDRFDAVMIDTAILDETGREFWTKHFPNRIEEIPWNLFVSELLSYLSLREAKTNSNSNNNNNNNNGLDFFNEKPSSNNNNSNNNNNNNNSNSGGEGEAHNVVKRIELQCFQAVLAEPSKTDKTVQVVSLEKFGAMLQWFGPLRDPQNPRAMFERIRNIILKSWFHGDITTPEAQSKLSGHTQGTYLVRFSTTHPGTYTISSIANSSVKHQRVAYIPSKGYSFNNHFYPSLDDIIHSVDSLVIPCSGSKYQSLSAADEVISPYVGYM